MEMTKYSAAIKNQLTQELAKQGSSLEEFEQALQNINTGDGVYKIAETTTNMTGNLMSAAGSIPEFAFKTTLAGGALGGLTLDEMDKSVVEVNKALAREREKINMVRRITENLKKEHGIV
jgi:hypothetical protein